jgi:2-oxo-4-hydroxy-4-carboxy--5-ureidoimidazoline (OHCU) decarboxylase
MAKIRVEGHESLVRDTVSNAVINSSTSEYNIYMARHRARNKQSDEFRTACKEINSLKAELREIKDLIKKVIEK